MPKGIKSFFQLNRLPVPNSLRVMSGTRQKPSFYNSTEVSNFGFNYRSQFFVDTQATKVKKNQENNLLYPTQPILPLEQLLCVDRSKRFQVAEVTKKVSSYDEVINLTENIIIGGSEVSWTISFNSFQSPQEAVTIVSLLRKNGINLIRGPIFNSLGVRRGLNQIDLKQLKLFSAVARRYKMAFIGQVTDVETLSEVAECSDIIEIFLNPQNGLDLLNEISSLRKVVIINRHPQTSVEDFISLVKILRQNVKQEAEARIILAEGGWFLSSGKNSINLSAVIEMCALRLFPVLVNCASVSSNPLYLEKVVMTAITAGASGIILGSDQTVFANKRSGINAQQSFIKNMVTLIKKTNAIKYTLNAVIHGDYQKDLS